MRVLPSLLVLAALATVASAQTAAATPTAARFAETSIEGFTVWVPADPPEARSAELNAALCHLEAQLHQVVRVVPRQRLADLRRVPIWVQLDSKTACAAYHPSRQWLLDHDYAPPDGLQSTIEIGNPTAFVRWTRQQPWMVLHELAHGHNHLNLAAGDGYRYEPLESRFREVVDAKIYERVLGYRGQLVRHYALSNHMELFAEATEAFFGVNDFYPFVRAELAQHDPETCALLEEIWSDDGARLRSCWQDGPHGPCRPDFGLDKVGRKLRSPPSGPTVCECEGFQVEVSAAASRQVGDPIWRLIGLRLHDVRRRLPAHALAVLDEVRIHVELDDPLVEHVAWFGPELKWRPKSIGIGDARRFEAIADGQPGLFLHLFAHAWYDLGLDDADRAVVTAAFARIREAGLYDRVLRLDGAEAASPVLLGPEELFAMLSAAWLGVSDHFPFVRAELEQHDPESFALIAELWSKRDAK